MFTSFIGVIGIMAAMPQEVELIQSEMKEITCIQVGKREFVQGMFEGVPVVFCLAGIGKVSAAVTAALLIDKFKVKEIIFTGVAGGGKATSVGDIVIGRTYLQHDLDLRPIFPQFYIYSLDKQILCAEDHQVVKMLGAANRFLEKNKLSLELQITKPTVYEGIIVSGDQFINSDIQHHEILDKTKEILSADFHAIEMEGAAVAQVCHEMNTPFIVMRAISDKADQKAGSDFSVFIDEIARHYSLGVLKEYFREKESDLLLSQ